MNRALAILLISVIMLASCRTAKHATETITVKPEKIAPQTLLDSVSRHHVDFEWLSFKARVDYTGDKRSENFTANIRMRKDSVIWASITSLMGIEVARLLITKDSVEVLDRLKKEIARVEKELETVRKKLANENFVANAPEAVVEEHRQRERDWADKLTQLMRMRDELQ